MFLDDLRPKRDRAERHHIPRRVVRIAEYRAEFLPIGIQDVDIRAPEFRRIIRDALHEHEFFVAGLSDDVYRVLYFGQGRGAGREHQGLAFPRDVLDHLEPCDVAGAYFVKLDADLVHEVNALVVVRGGRGRDAYLPAIFEKFLVPLAGKFHFFEHLVDGTLPATVHSFQLHGRESFAGNYSRGFERLYLDAIGADPLRFPRVLLCFLQTPIEIRTDLRDEIRRRSLTYATPVYLEIL